MRIVTSCHTRILGIGLVSLSLLSARAGAVFTAEDRNHWAFQAARAPALPVVRRTDWIQNAVDAFVLEKLEAQNLSPASVADKITLLRRASLDLIGLPPTPEEVDAFLRDKSSGAFAKVVERLLDSPHYGERWARHWLDLARYAESEGFKADETRPNAWRYRDYVIEAFNADKPYDRFIKEQLAGDELWPGDADATIATAFNRHYPDESNARNLMQRRQELLNDITDTVGAVFVGVTYACARCHDHKYDPILQKDYYRLQAFFANSAASDNIELSTREARQGYRKQLALWEEKTQCIRDEMASLEEPKRQAIIRDYIEKYPDEIRSALSKFESERNPFECQMVAKAMLYLDPTSHQFVGNTKDVVAGLKGEQKKRWERLNAQLKEYAPLHPGELPLATGLVDLGKQAPKTYLLNRGIYDAPKDEVEPGFLSLLDPSPAKVVAPNGLNSTGRRTALAKILTDPRNPLTARVMANRIWHYHFGRGLVATPSDFGRKGEPPTHPQLLDWLASEFVRSGWSIKQMHRLIMNSSTYQQAAGYRESCAKVDPDNKLLWRFSRQRLEGEVIRDAALAASGLLNAKMGGPSVFPELPPGMTVRGGWKTNESQPERLRRSIYVFVRRNTRYPLFESFDMPDTHESCPRRNITTNPLQALNLLNSEVALRWAQSLAGRVLREGGSDWDHQVETAYRIALARTPTQVEKDTIRAFFDQQQKIIDERIAAGEEIALPIGASDCAECSDRKYAAALVDFCHMLMNANEFVYRN